MGNPDGVDETAHDLTYAEARAAAQPRLAKLAAQATELTDQIFTAWRAIEPNLRAWIAQAETLTEQQWMDEPEHTREFFDRWRAWFAEHDAHVMEDAGREDSQP